MSLTNLYRHVRLYKTRRPSWMDSVPRDDPELRQSYSIAARHEQKFSQAFMAFQRSFITEDIEREMIKRLKANDLNGALEAIPFFQEGSTDDHTLWQRFGQKLESAYSDIILDAGKAETKRMNDTFKTNLGFSLGTDQVEKKRKTVPIVPVNPYSINWIQTSALSLVKQGITKTQLDVVREVLLNSYSKGLRAEVIMDEVKSNIGLTVREYKAVQNRFKLHMETGLPKPKVDSLTLNYRDKLLKARSKRIARTETIAAQAHGRNTTWRLAQEQGSLPVVERVWAAPPESPNPDSPCEICIELNDVPAEIGQPYTSLFIGQVMHPPAHPNCRCTELLRKKV